jgi:hypothetical protein
MMKGLATVSQTLGHIQSIHGATKYFANEAKNVKIKNPFKVSEDFTFYGAESAKVGEPVVFFGTAMPGIIEVYSANRMERKLYAKNGEYYLSLFFSKPGIYDMYAINMGVESKHIPVTVTD